MYRGLNRVLGGTYEGVYYIFLSRAHIGLPKGTLSTSGHLSTSGIIGLHIKKSGASTQALSKDMILNLSVTDIRDDKAILRASNGAPSQIHKSGSHMLPHTYIHACKHACMHACHVCVRIA